MRLLLIILGVVFTANVSAQGKGEFWVRHWINPNKKNHSHDAFFKTKKVQKELKKGWVVEKKIDGKTYQIVLDNNETVEVMEYEKADSMLRWRATGEVKFSDDDPSKLYLNPMTFVDSSNYNTKAYIKIPENKRLTIATTFWRISPLTIPFGIRMKLNDTIRSKATADLNLGVGFSFNLNADNFKNKRLKAIHTSYGVSFGCGFGFSKISLTSENTSLTGNPVKEDENGLAFTFAPGIGINLQELSVVGFYAIDFPLTGNVHKWTYYNKGYFGLGLGVNLSAFGSI